MNSRTWTRLAVTILLNLGASVAAAQAAGGSTASPLGTQGLFFEANGGRYDPAASFLVRAPGYRMFLLPGEHRLALRDSRAGGDHYAAALCTTFVGADPAAEIVGEDELVTRIHYLRGKDPAGWSTNNRTFGSVRYRELWPGIDLVMYDAEGQLELDFVVAPGADPAAIRVRHDGVSELERLTDGRLRLASPVGDLLLSAPIVYQDGARRREYVAGSFRIDADGTVGFDLADYDRSRPLVIDPVLAYSTYLAGTLNDELTDVATDAAGNAYVCGSSSSVDLPTTAGVFQTAKDVETDAVIAKLSPRGDTLLWCTYLGGGESAAPASAWANDNAWAIEVDGSGHVYIGGSTSTEDFPTTPGALQTTYVPGYNYDGFVSKLTPSGDSLVWSTYLGDSGHDYVYGLAVASNGDVVAVGQGTSLFPTTNVLGFSTGKFGFVTRIAATGSSLVYSTIFNGSGTTGPITSSGVTDVELDSAGRVYGAGFTNASNFPVANAFQSSWAGGIGLDGICFRLAADGSAFEYSTYLGGTGNEDSYSRLGYGIAAEDSGRAWFTCNTFSTDFPLKNAFQTTKSGTTETVVVCLDTNESGDDSLLWSTYLGGSGNDVALDIEADALGNSWVVCNTSSTNYPLIEPWRTDQPFGDLGLTAFDPNGVPLFSTYLGGSGAESYSSDDLARLAIDADGNVYVAGSTSSLDLGTAGSLQPGNPSPAFSGAGFLAKFTSLSSLSDLEQRDPCFGVLPTNSLRALTGAVLGQTLSVEIGAPTKDMSIQPGSLTFWYVSALPSPGYPCGTAIPGWGINGAVGELLLGPFSQQIRVGGAGHLDHNSERSVHSVLVPDDPSLDGAVLYSQGVILQYLPVSTPALVTITQTNGLELTFGR